MKWFYVWFGLCSVGCFHTVAASSPIEQIVGRVVRIDGDPTDARMFRQGQSTELKTGTFVLYGDRLAAGIRATVFVNTRTRRLIIGGDFSPEWRAPAATEASAPSVSAFLQTLFEGLTDRTSTSESAYLLSRGPQHCPTPDARPLRLEPLGRLRNMEQRLGADIQTITIGWRPLTTRQDVRLRLLGDDGMPLVESHACSQGHMSVEVPVGVLHAGDRLRLEISAGTADPLIYRVTVIAMADLPLPPEPIAPAWAEAAWRVASGPGDLVLDSISRIEMAPSDALGAEIILEAIWADTAFQ